MRTEQEHRTAKKPCLRPLPDGLPLGAFEASLVFLALLSSGSPADAQVKREWVVTYDGNEPSLGWRWDTVDGAGLDSAGNLHLVVSVTRPGPGRGQVQVGKVQKYGPGGNLLWDVQEPELHSHEGFAVDPEGNTYIAGCTGDNPAACVDFLTLKYDPAGHLCWAARRDFDGRNDFRPSLAIDESGNVYVVGASTAQDEQGVWQDWRAKVKYDSGGHEVWAIIDTNWRAYHHYCADSFGNTYGGRSDPGYVVSKYGPDGQNLWAAAYVGPANGTDELWDLALDAEGNVHLTGASQGSDGLWDCATAKFSPDGEQLWAARYEGPDRREDWAWALAIDSTGNVYVTGPSGRSDGWDWLTLKYDPDGNELWARRYPDCENPTVWRPPLAVDRAGNVYLAFNIESKGLTIVKYDPDGNEVWGGAGLGVITPGGVSWTLGAWLFVDDAYNVYFATTIWNGYASEGGTDGDFLIAKFSQDSPSFRRGDADASGALQLTDAVFTLGYLFQAGTAPGCLDAADADDNGAVEITDAIFTLNHLFLGGPPLPSPTGSCSTDPSEDGLDCEDSPACP